MFDFCNKDPFAFIKFFFPSITFLEDFQIENLEMLKGVMTTDDPDKFVNWRAIVGCKGCGKTTELALECLTILFLYNSPVINIYTSSKQQSQDTIFKACCDILKENETIIVTLKDGRKTAVNGLLKYCNIKRNSITLNIKGVPKNLFPDSSGIQCGSINRDSNKGDSLAGRHSKTFNLLILDEATVFTKSEIDTLSGVTSSGRAMVVLAGNASTTNCEFYRITNKNHPSELYTVRYVRGGELKRPEYNYKAQCKQYMDSGIDAYKMFVEAEWIESGVGSIFSPNKFDIALRRGDEYLKFNIDHWESVLLTKYKNTCVVGVDVSHGSGNDYHCIVVRYDDLFELIYYNNKDSINDLKIRCESIISLGCKLAIDSCGAGKSIAMELSHYRNVTQINGGGRPLVFDNTFYFDANAFMLDSLEKVSNRESFTILLGAGISSKSSTKVDILSQIGMFRYDYDDKKGKRIKNVSDNSPDIIRAMSYTLFLGHIKERYTNLKLGSANTPKPIDYSEYREITDVVLNRW